MTDQTRGRPGGPSQPPQNPSGQPPRPNQPTQQGTPTPAGQVPPASGPANPTPGTSTPAGAGPSTGRGPTSPNIPSSQTPGSPMGMPRQGEPQRGTMTQPSQPVTERVAEQGREAVNSFSVQVREQVVAQFEHQKGRASEGLGGVALALRQTSQNLREQGRNPVAEYAERGAEQVETLSNYLRQHDIDEVVSEVESFARRSPAVFVGAAFGLGFLVSRFLKSSTPPTYAGQSPRMGTMGSGTSGESMPGGVERSIEVRVPLHNVYNQWTQFEDFPRFMEGVKEVHQLDDKRLHWRAEIAGKTEEWTAVITEQVPDRIIAWRNTSGARNAGRVTFHSVDPTTTRVTLRLDYQPEGIIENIGSALGLVERRVMGDLQRFKEFIESRGVPTGGWRGEVHNESVTKPQ